MNNKTIIKEWIKESHYSGFMIPVEAIPMMDRARADTAREIFAELDKRDCGVGEITAENGANLIRVRAIKLEKYNILRKKYGIEEAV